MPWRLSILEAWKVCLVAAVAPCDEAALRKTSGVTTLSCDDAAVRWVVKKTDPLLGSNRPRNHKTNKLKKDPLPSLKRSRAEDNSVQCS
jgi:hypothetical protein